MPFVIIFFTPIIFGCSVYRLLNIPMQIRNGTITLKSPLPVTSHILAVVAYLLLLGGSLAFCYGLYLSLTGNAHDIKAILKFAAYYEFYPAIYVLAEWRFYHVFERPGRVRPVAHKPGMESSISQAV